MIETTCWKCGERFGLADATMALLRRNQQTFHCPWGHAAVFTAAESEADKLRRERDRLKQQAAQKDDEIRMWQATANDQRAKAEHERSRANGYKGHAAKITKRAKAGVCPCCNRHFAALERHMASKHPQFTPDVAEPVLKVVGGTAHAK